MTGFVRVERGHSVAVVYVLSLDNFKELFTLAQLGSGNQLRPVMDHVVGQFVDLVCDFTNTIDTLFFGFPEIVRVRGDNLK